MMQIGLRFHDAKVLPFEERIREVKNQGFSCVHMALSKVMPNPAFSPGGAYARLCHVSEEVLPKGRDGCGSAGVLF